MTTYFITYNDRFGYFHYYKGVKTALGWPILITCDFTIDINSAICYTLEEAKIIQKEAGGRDNPLYLEIYECIPPSEPRLGKKYDEKEHIIGLLTDMSKIEFFSCSHNGKVIQMAIDYIKEKT
jgi:hypothetical protein